MFVWISDVNWMTHFSIAGKQVEFSLWMTFSFQHLKGIDFGSLSVLYTWQYSKTLSVFGNRIQVRRLIKESGVYEKRSTYRRSCWYVHADVLASHSQEALPVPCQWKYLTSGAQITREEPASSQGNSPTSQSTSSTPSNKRKCVSNHTITKYMKKNRESEQVWKKRLHVLWFWIFIFKLMQNCNISMRLKDFLFDDY